MPEERYKIGKKHQSKHERQMSRSAKKDIEQKYLLNSQENISIDIDIDKNKSIYSSVSKGARPKTPSAHKNNSGTEDRF